MTDTVGRIVEQWAVQRPDLDASPMLVIGRIHRVGDLLDAALRPPFARAGLGPGDFNVLAALRRAGPPYELTAGDLREALMVTSGAITKQVDRLLAQGLVERRAAGHDARIRNVRLTAQGVALVDELVSVHLDNERRLLSSLTEHQRGELADILESLARDLEDAETAT